MEENSDNCGEQAVGQLSNLTSLTLGGAAVVHVVKRN